MLVINKVSFVFLILAVGIFGYGYYVYNEYDWLAAEESIDLGKKEEYQLEFISQKNVVYELGLETEVKLNIKEQKCRLGIRAYDINSCEKYPETLIVEWQIHQEGKAIFSGNSNEAYLGSWGNHSIHKLLTRFKTEKGKKYTVHIKISENDIALAPTNPVIKISIGQVQYKNAYVTFSIAMIASCVLLGLSVFLWFVGLMIRRWKIKKEVL